MRMNPVFALFAFAISSAHADPVVGTKAFYDYTRDVRGQLGSFVQTKEVLELHPEGRTYSEKTVYSDAAGNVVQEGVIPDQPYDRFELSDVFFFVRCATHLNGKTVDGVRFGFEEVTVPMGTYRVCRLSYDREGLRYDEYLADGVAFNAVKTVITDAAAGIVRTSVLRSIAQP